MLCVGCCVLYVVLWLFSLVCGAAGVCCLFICVGVVWCVFCCCVVSWFGVYCFVWCSCDVACCVAVRVSVCVDWLSVVLCGGVVWRGVESGLHCCLC